MAKIKRVTLGIERKEFCSVPFSARANYDRQLIYKDGKQATLTAKQAEENAMWLTRKLRRAHYDEQGTTRVCRIAYSLQQVATFKQKKR